ncbi:MAG: hypothetical protein KDD03_11875, partial [Gelidibacter sp.]|nr:hypothetical protein [Gelidibacter sp.]
GITIKYAKGLKMPHKSLDEKVQNLKESFEFLNQIFEEMYTSRLKSVEGLVDDVERYKLGLDEEIFICHEHDTSEIVNQILALYMLEKFDWNLRKVFEKALDPAESFLQNVDIEEIKKEDIEDYKRNFFDIDHKRLEINVANALQALDKG